MRLKFLGLLFILSILVFPIKANAQTPMENNNYRLQSGQVDFPEDQNEPSADMKSYGSYSFNISESLIDFGEITPTNPLTRKNSITTNSNRKYFLKAYENHQLLSTQSASMPDTTCDSGNCSDETPDIWKSVLTYGFGFHCESNDKPCGQDFTTMDTFAQFANKLTNEPYNSILNGAHKANRVDLTYKINISSQQRPAAYTNTVTLLFLPSY